MSALPGRVRLWPYQKEIADAISDPMIERVTLVKGVRLGFTTLLTGAIGADVANEPAAILALLPTDADCRDYVVSELERRVAPRRLRVTRSGGFSKPEMPQIQILLATPAGWHSSPGRARGIYKWTES